MRRAIRNSVAPQAAGGRDASLNWQFIMNQLRAPGFRDAWQAVQCIESHDEVYVIDAQKFRALGGGGNEQKLVQRKPVPCIRSSLSWTQHLGIPMILMGQETLRG